MNQTISHNLQVAFSLGWQDVKQSYRRSPIGPFWLTVNMAVLISTMGLVFGLLFKMDFKEYLPYLAIGLIVWNFVSTVITEASLVFVNSEALIKQINLKTYVFVVRLLWKNFAIFLHNLVLVPVILIVLGIGFTWSILLAFVGLFLVLVNLGWIVVALGILATRYRDFNQLTVSFLSVVFYLTPVVWHRDILDVPWAELFVTLNPFTALLEIVREPFIGEMPGINSWLVAIGLAVVGWSIAALLFRRYSHRIAYWV